MLHGVALRWSVVWAVEEVGHAIQKGLVSALRAEEVVARSPVRLSAYSRHSND